MIPNRLSLREAILKNLAKIEFVCDYYADPRFSPHFLSFAGVMHHLVGSHEQAVGLFEKILKTYPDFMYASIIQCAIGIILEENLNNPGDAAEAYRAVIAKYPGSFETDAAQDGLDRVGR
jgi:tetratricopeptide (TPR) repeat protein